MCETRVLCGFPSAEGGQESMDSDFSITALGASFPQRTLKAADYLEHAAFDPVLTQSQKIATKLCRHLSQTR
jgi:hypothetical protein